MTTPHALLSPSSMHRLENCGGSKKAFYLPSKSSKAADDGTELHEQAYGCLRDASLEPAPEIAEYVRFVRDLPSQLETGTISEYEITLASRRYPDIFFGTIDALVVSREELWVVDLKTGQTPVSARHNAQLESYLTIARDHYPYRSSFFGVIHQFGREDIWEFSAEDLDRRLEKVPRIVETDQFHAGEWCQWCPLLAACEVADERAQKIAQAVFDSDVSIEKCLEIISFAPVVAELEKSAKLELRNHIMSGGEVPGWRLAQPLGNRKWIDVNSVSDYYLDRGVDPAILFDKRLYTPAQIEKRTGEKVPTELVSRERKAVIAVPDTSKQPVYDPAGVFDD